MSIKNNPGIQTMPKTERDWNKFINDLSDLIDAIQTDVPPSGDFVTLDTPQTITSIKAFTANPLFNTDPLWNNANVGTQIYSLQRDLAPDGAADYAVTYDVSTDMPKRVLLDDLPGGGGAGQDAMDLKH